MRRDLTTADGKCKIAEQRKRGAERMKHMVTSKRKKSITRRKIKELLSGILLGTLIGGAFAGMFLHWLIFGYIHIV